MKKLYATLFMLLMTTAAAAQTYYDSASGLPEQAPSTPPPYDWWGNVFEPALTIGIISIVLIILLTGSMRIAKEYERLVIFRLGKFRRVAGPGLIFKNPLFDRIEERVTLQTVATTIKAEASLTKDTVPVNVKTVLYWQVIDPKAAAINVESYYNAIVLTAQVALREAIGATDFTDLLSKRDTVDDLIRIAVARKAKDWGLEVLSVEIQDVVIPDDLQEAMSREAQAEREKHARIILGASEIEIAKQLIQAAEIYDSDPTALRLRAMNIIYETTKERGATILLPSDLVDAFRGRP
jgi:regulator of protease activity HflC (stomatin/prohibitin superfamily)